MKITGCKEWQKNYPLFSVAMLVFTCPAFSFNKRTLFLVVCDCDGGDEYDDEYDVMLLNGGSK